VTTTDINTAAIILSGGAGTRLNGADKGLQVYQGQPLIEHVIKVISPQVASVYICANRNIEAYKSLGFRVLSDQHQKYQGPMSGISSALRLAVLDSEAEQILITSCDAPHLPKNLATRLESGLLKSVAAVVSIAHDGQRKQNLHCLIKREAWPSLIEFFDDGGRAMHRWFDEVISIEVDFSDQASGFLNINTSKQLES
jgi:molybdenum cofactor guanylyltransferase